MFDRGDHPYSTDLYDRAREALINDVAAFAGRQYEAVVVFDAAGNVSPERPNLPQGGVRIEFSPRASQPIRSSKTCAQKRARREGMLGGYQ